MRRTLLVGLALVVAGALLGLLVNLVVGIVVAVIGVGFALPTCGSDSGGSDADGGSMPTVFTDGGGHGGGPGGPGPS
jgi:hypothetical protein